MNLLKKIRAAYHQWQAFRCHKKIQRHQEMMNALHRPGDYELQWAGREYRNEIIDTAWMHNGKWLELVGVKQETAAEGKTSRRTELRKTLHQALNKIGVIDLSGHSQ